MIIKPFSQKYKVFLFFIFIILWSGKLLAQDVHFSQIEPIYLNPALSGTNGYPQLRLHYRNQWAALPNAYVTYSAAFDTYIKKLNGGLGFYLMNDVLGNGIYQQISALTSYSHRIEINKNLYLNTGISFSFHQNYINSDDFVWGDMLQNATNKSHEIVSKQKYNFFDTGAGFVLYSSKINFGISVQHLLEPNSTAKKSKNDKINRKYTSFFGINFVVSNRYSNKKPLTLSPMFLYDKQQDYQQFSGALTLKSEKLKFGIILHSNFTTKIQNIGFLFGLNFNSLKINYSYDLSQSEVQVHSGGSHEIVLILLFGYKRKHNKFKAINCPNL